MRWRSGGSAAVAPESPSTDENSLPNHDQLTTQSSSLDEDEPDTSSQDPVHADDGDSKDLHGRLGSSEPPLEDLLEGSGKKSLEEEKKQSDNTEDDDDRLRDKRGGASSRGEVIEDDDGADHAEPPSIPWKAQNVQSTCEFTHSILDYAQKRESGCKKAEYSATTVDEFGNRWRLIVYVNGNGRASNHHLSLFLQVADADDLPFGWKKAVSYVLTLEHPQGGGLSYAKRNPDKTFKLCPKAIDWGWSQFITSDRIQQEGFVSGDTLTVRASVTVKSSSVSIDEEDSELYLKCAVEEGDAEAVKLCLDQGASVNCKFKDDLYTPLHTACSSGTNNGSMEVLNLLLEHGANGNACNKWRETPLLIAANNGHRAAVEALLSHGADPSLCSEAGWSALTFAAHKGFDDIVALLLKAGAPVNCRVTEDASTPLHKACAGSKDGHLPSVKLLLDGDADVHALNKWRETPLLTAANHGQAGAVEALLLAGADPCRCTDTGWSPLSIAAYKGHDDVVRLLLEEGAPTEEEDPTLSALLQAATKGLPDTVELLLRHGADHTVTTKKGDTALSILVEQNLIDAAVEMVTEYSASIPRCSRDRKKVQRARLLINLRMKQIEREGNNNSTDSTDEDETDGEDSESSNSALHLQNGESPTDASHKKKKRGKSPKVAAEEKARAAEEALLLELEQEDAQAKKEEAEASSKRAKRKKKKEREKRQKMKEEKERREREKREAEELERSRKEMEEKERKLREQRQKEQREREMLEMMEREKVLAAKRKERDERVRREREQKQRAKQSQKEAATPTASPDKRPKPPKAKKAASVGVSSVQSVARPTAVTTPSAIANVASAPGNRRWETTAKSPRLPVQQASNKKTGTERIPSIPRSASHPELSSVEPTPSSFLSPRPGGQQGTRSRPGFPALTKNETAALPPSSTPVNGVHSHLVGGTFEHPAVALFRRDKVVELQQQCKRLLKVVDERSLKRTFYRWIVRSAHGLASSIDPMIPSGTDLDHLVTFFQRQFISESRRGSAGSPVVPEMNMEALKDAGSSVAILCQGVAKEVAQFRQRVEEQLPRDWTDAALGMTASDGTPNGSGTVVSLSWANRGTVYIPSLIFSTLRDRHISSSNRFLAAVFVAKVWYDTKRLVVADSEMDFRLPPTAQSCLSIDASVSAELWSDPFVAFRSNVFWGNFEEIDYLFGGQKPFGKYERGGEEVLARHGGSVSVLLPFDTMVASRYAKRIFDLVESANSANVPVSFAVFIHAECFYDLPSGPSPGDLHLLDPRFSERKHSVRHVHVLSAGQHVFQCGEGAGRSEVSTTRSLVAVLQSEAGRTRFDINDASVMKIIASMSGNLPSPGEDPVVTQIGFPGDFTTRESPLTPHSAGFEGLAPRSPEPLPMQLDFGMIGGTAISKKSFSPANEAIPRSRRGRLFELVDDGEEDHLNDVDIVSGMLSSLDVGLFEKNAGSDVDIEAISLMGIGGPPSQQVSRGTSNSGRFGLAHEGP